MSPGLALQDGYPDAQHEHSSCGGYARCRALDTSSVYHTLCVVQSSCHEGHRCVILLRRSRHHETIDHELPESTSTRWWICASPDLSYVSSPATPASWMHGAALVLYNTLVHTRYHGTRSSIPTIPATRPHSLVQTVMLDITCPGSWTKDPEDLGSHVQRQYLA